MLREKIQKFLHSLASPLNIVEAILSSLIVYISMAIQRYIYIVSERRRSISLSNSFGCDMELEWVLDQTPYWLQIEKYFCLDFQFDINSNHWLIINQSFGRLCLVCLNKNSSQGEVRIRSFFVCLKLYKKKRLGKKSPRIYINLLDELR